MSDKDQQLNPYEIQQTAEAIEKLAANPKAFGAAYEAFVAGDAAKFGAALSQVGIEDQCHWVCRFFCRKRCVGVCRKFCPQPVTAEVNADEILNFVKAADRCFAIRHSSIDCVTSSEPETSTDGTRRSRRTSCNPTATSCASSCAGSAAMSSATRFARTSR